MKITYSKSATDQRFLKELQLRVAHYFASTGQDKHGNTLAYMKAAMLLLLYITIHSCIYLSASVSTYCFLHAAMGIVTIFTALNVAHDAAHGTLTRSRKWNKRLLYTFDILGVSGYMWRLKHVYSHHAHVNIPDMDGDIKQSALVRIFPNSPFKSFHRYQYLYMPVLYLFYTLFWFFIRDFRDHFSPTISGKPDCKIPLRAQVQFFLVKLFFIGRLIIVPLVLLPFSGGQVLTAFLIYHLTASATVAMALISTHIGEDSVYPQANDSGVMSHSWVRHQLITTSDFATENTVLTHLFGGFNHHVVHHLFPGICHIHYPSITKILRQTCLEYKMPYRCSGSLLEAMYSHLRFLRLRSNQGLAVEYIDM